MGCAPIVRSRYILVALKSNNASPHTWGGRTRYTTRYGIFRLTGIGHLSSMPRRGTRRNPGNPGGGGWSGGQEEGDQKEEEV